MSKFHHRLILAGILVAAGCSDQSTLPTAPRSPDHALTPSLAAAAQPQGVGAVGVVEQVNAQERTLVLLQTGLEFRPGEGVRVVEERHQFAVGARDATLRVAATPDTRVYLNAEEKTFADLEAGTQVIILGQVVGEILQASAITDLTPVEPPPGAREMIRKRVAEASSNPRLASQAAGEETSICVAQDLDYPDPDVLEFQGCWGFPSISDEIDVDVPFFWVLLGYLKIDYFSYVAGLSGYSFAYPFRFTAAAGPPLVYHVPAEVSLGVEGLPALPGSFTFTGGFGLDFGVNFDFCTNFGDCSDLETFHVGVGQTYESHAAGPTDTQTYVDIEEPTCLGIGVLPIKGFSPLTASYCWDLRFDGQPFTADVRATGTRPVASGNFEFQSGTYAMPVRPDATEVTIRFDNMSWEPTHTTGGYFMLDVFSFEVWRSDNLFATSHGSLPFVSNPFPRLGMTLARKRSGELAYQPTFIETTLPVAPAPTQLTIASGHAIADGTPVSVRLSEAYDDSAIPGQTVTIQATGVGGTPSVAAPVTTDDAGIASLMLPAGEYHIAAQYAGAPTYEPAAAQMTSVFVYRPTTFVIWGGNTGGVVPGARVQFWGHGWSTQVLDGPYGGNASFQGFAIRFGESLWASPPASSGLEPATIPDVIGVIITTHVEGRGSNTVGNIAGWAVLRVDNPAAYLPNSGHIATGVVRATLQ